MAILTDSDLELMGLMLPAQRRRVLQEIRLFRELGCPQASEINADALEQHQTEAATLEQHHMDAFQGLLEGEVHVASLSADRGRAGGSTCSVSSRKGRCERRVSARAETSL